MVIFITLRTTTGDKAQILYAQGLEELFEGVEVKEPQAPQGQRSEGVLLNSKGKGPLMFVDTLFELHDLGYGLTKAYRNQKGDKITFVAEEGQFGDPNIIDLFKDLTAESGWTVCRYENSKGIAYSAVYPVNMLRKYERAEANGKSFSPTQVIISLK